MKKSRKKAIRNTRFPGKHNFTIGFDPNTEDIEIIIRPVRPGQKGKVAVTYLGPGGGGGGAGLPGLGSGGGGRGGAGAGLVPSGGGGGGPLGDFHANDPKAGAGISSDVHATGGQGNQVWQLPEGVSVSSSGGASSGKSLWSDVGASGGDASPRPIVIPRDQNPV